MAVKQNRNCMDEILNVAHGEIIDMNGKEMDRKAEAFPEECPLRGKWKKIALVAAFIAILAAACTYSIHSFKDSIQIAFKK